ncbi:MAG: flagellar filament capping protein FliD [Pseudomonadota bacterium]|uniref:flagellar filament capping protein FliD n=1 Tax=Pseudoalteromonas TaxID=53246 RepID=UPI00026C9EB2|nr:flagellar filament capping protein FliD [Pseudoalteromonas spongiae]ATC98053.1 flagellar hook-associated protein 2 [Pseudoalteromonas spongiae UST010723-006]MEC8327266.1 flagellar filament capping protein FliD [Pseudomonadota bacterium]
MAGITAAGVGSGLDLETIIKTTLLAEKTPKEQQLNKREIQYATELSGVGTFKSALDNFNSALAELAKEETFTARTVSFKNGLEEDKQAFEIFASSTVQSGEFAIEVQALAQGSKLESAALGSATDPVGSGNLTFAAGGNSFSIAVDAADTLEDIREKINAAGDNFGVSANIINSDAGAVLTFNSDVTGDGNSLTVTADDDSLASIATSAPTAAAGLTETQAAGNARALINGQLVTDSDNKLSDKIQGTVITLKETTTGAETVTIGVDQSEAKEKLKGFVDAYNELKSQLDGLSDPENGLLAADGSIRIVEQQLQRMFTGEISGTNTNVKSLYDLGITFDREGKMEISSIALGTNPSGTERFESALSDNFSEVQSLFVGDTGLGKQVNDYVELFTGKKGSLVERETTLNESMEDITIEREKLEVRLDELEASLRSQYAALDRVMAQYQVAGSYIANILPVTKSSKD